MTTLIYKQAKDHLLHTPPWKVFWRAFARGFFPSIPISQTIAEVEESVNQDYDAIKSDWEAVGQDLWGAIEQFKKEHPELD